jgi:hypothetical protein
MLCNSYLQQMTDGMGVTRLLPNLQGSNVTQYVVSYGEYTAKTWAEALQTPEKKMFAARLDVREGRVIL